MSWKFYGANVRLIFQKNKKIPIFAGKYFDKFSKQTL